MDIWIGLGMGIVIGLLLGVLLAALGLQSRLKRAQQPSPEIARLQGELAALGAEVARAREDAAKARADADEHQKMRATLAHEQSMLKTQYATVQSMLSSANKEKERLLLDNLTMRGERDDLQRELAVLRQQPEA